MFRTTAIITAAAAVAITAVAVPSESAHAGRKHDRFFKETIITSQKVRGYEGFASGGKFGVYCSYYRVPIRSCTYDRSGRESCRVVGWKMDQMCR